MEDLVVARLSHVEVPSPYPNSRGRFVGDEERVLVSAEIGRLADLPERGARLPAFEVAGPRSTVAFEPTALTCGIVTCGGLCPGVNNVIRAIVLTLTHGYGIRRILGFRYGFAGLSRNSYREPLALSPEVVEDIPAQGGTILGSSRGPQDVGEMVDHLVRRDVGLLFAIGGDGTLRGASAIAKEIERRGLRIGVVGVPKTIDNDIMWIERSFGFATAVEEARLAIAGAHAEARGAWNGIGLVKLMGRQAGFIAVHATLANPVVNFCLVPEVPFALHGFLDALERRLASRHHAVIVIGEGAAQELVQDPRHIEHDPSGNVRLKDVGVFLRGEILGHFAMRGIETTLKYIDPSYIIRSLPANSLDSEFCLMLGQQAVHAGMAGRTDVVIGYWNHHFTHVPIPLAVRRGKQLDPGDATWQRVLEATGQPAFMG